MLLYSGSRLMYVLLANRLITEDEYLAFNVIAICSAKPVDLEGLEVSQRMLLHVSK